MGTIQQKTGKWTIGVDNEKDFDLNDGEEKTLTIKFNLYDLDEDFSDLADGDFEFYVRATGDVDSSPDFTTCTSESKGLDIITDDEFVVLNDVQILDSVSCDSDLQISAKVWNIGDEDQDEVYAVIFNKELGINKKVEIGGISAFDSEKLESSITIPKDAEEKSYSLTVYLYNQDDELFSNKNDQESEFEFPITVEGGCSGIPLASIAAELQSDVKAGKDLIVKATIVNTGAKESTFTLSASNYADWASSAVLDKTSVTLAAGASQEVLVTLKINKDALGEKKFNIELVDGNKFLAQPVLVEVEKSSFLPANITGFFTKIGGDNWYLWGIGALNILLVIVIIIVAVKVVKKKEE